MSAGTGISWCISPDGTPGWTLNAILGCSKCSTGCDGCYAILQAWIRAHNPHPAIAAAFAGLVVKDPETGTLDWTGKINFLPERLVGPRKRRKRTTYFVNSLSDMFHPRVLVLWIAQMYATFAVTPQHIYQILTKRPARAAYVLDGLSRVDRARGLPPGTHFRHLVMAEAAKLGFELDLFAPGAWPLPNVWLGVSAENPAEAARRIPILVEKIPSAVCWASIEPLVEATSFAPYAAKLDWAVVGGESGGSARRMDPQWAADILRDFTAAGTPVFFKQAGVVLAREWGCEDQHGDRAEEWPEEFRIQQFPPQLTAAWPT